MAARAQKVVVFLVVTTAHVAAIMSIRWSPNTRVESVEDVFGTLLVIESPRQPKPNVTPQRAERHRAAEDSTAIEAIPIESISDPSEFGPIDWQKQSGLSARTVVNRQLHDEALHPLISKPKTLTPAPEKVEMGIFTLTPPHKPGTFEYLGEGVTREWVSEYCYYWSDVGPEGRVPRKKCLPKFANPNSGNLFKQFRPKYLDTLQQGDPSRNDGQSIEARETLPRVPAESADTVPEKNR